VIWRSCSSHALRKDLLGIGPRGREMAEWITKTQEQRAAFREKPTNG
jgi:hypothetical protein